MIETVGAIIVVTLVGALVIAPVIVRGTRWLIDRDPVWVRWWMRWVGGKEPE